MGAKTTPRAAARARPAARPRCSRAARGACTSGPRRGGVRKHCGNATLVVNVGGTSAPRYAVRRLRAKFAAAGGRAGAAQRCAALGCGCAGAATAHVRHVDGRRSGAWQLAWVCAAHNAAARRAPYALRKNARLVPLAAVRSKPPKRRGAARGKTKAAAAAAQNKKRRPRAASSGRGVGATKRATK
jgi:hypothetical protein